jgi:hypothetical protein
MTSQAGWEIDDTGPAVAQPTGNSRSRLLVQYLPEPGRPSTPSASTARRRNHYDVRTLARAKAIRHPHVGDVSNQIAKLGKLGLVVDTRVLLGRATAAPPAHGDAGSGSVQRHSADPPRCVCDLDGFAFALQSSAYEAASTPEREHALNATRALHNRATGI